MHWQQISYVNVKVIIFKNDFYTKIPFPPKQVLRVLNNCKMLFNPLDTSRNLILEKMSRTYSECLMHVQFIYCVQKKAYLFA